MSSRWSRGLDRADHLLDRFAALFAVIGGMAVFGLMMVTVIAVFWRYLLNSPIFGIEDLSVLALIVVAGSSVAFGATRGAHVSVDVIARFLGPTATWLADLVMRAVVVLTTGLATFALFAKACGPQKACVTSNLGIDHRPYYYFLGAALGFFAVGSLVHLLRTATETPWAISDEAGE